MHLRIRRKPSSPHALLTNFTAVADMSHIVGNKAKGRISKRVFQENKARQIFRKTQISNPLIRTRALLPYYQRICSAIRKKILITVSLKTHQL